MADRSVRVRLLADVQAYREGMRQAARATADFGREVTSNTQQGNQALEHLGRGSLVAGGVLAAGFGLAVNAAMGFEKQMSELGAVAGGTSSDLDALRQAAIDAGQATAFSASEAAVAATELAKAGIATADILGGGLSGALDLAAAGGLELGQAAEFAAQAMTTFGLAGSDVTHIADVLAAGANKSAADVDDMAQALQQTGLVAAQLGLTIDDTAGVLALFAQNGLRGSDAGTSFKTMLQRLVPQSAEASETMQQLGIDFFDARGQFIGIEGAAGELHTALAGLSQEQRTAAMTTLFGADAIRAATVLYEAGADGVDQWVTAVNDTGFAADLAAERMDNLAGDLETLRGSIDTALIQGGSQATGALRFMAQGATDMVNEFSEMPSALQGAAVGFAGVTGAGLLTLGAVGSMIPKIREARLALVELGPAGAQANRALGTVGAAAGKVGLLTTALFALNTALEGLHHGPSADLSVLANDLLDLGESGEVAGELASSMGEDLDKLREAIERVGAPSNATRLLQIGNEITSLGGLLQHDHGLEDARERIDLLDQALADLAAQDPNAAAAAFRALTGALAEQGVPVERVRGLLDDYRSALAEIDTQQRTTGESTAGFGQAIDATVAPGQRAATTYEAASDALRGYLDRIRGITDPMFGLVNAQHRNAEAQDDVGRATVEQAEAQEELERLQRSGTATQEELEQAGRDLWDATVGVRNAQLSAVESAGDLESAQMELVGAIELGDTSIDEFNEALVRWASQGAITTEQAMLLSAELSRLVDLANQAHALDLARLLNPGTYFDPNRLYLKPGTKRAAGGYIPGPSGAGDVTPLMGTPGEFVIREPAAAALGSDTLWSLNSADRWSSGAGWQGGAAWEGAGASVAAVTAGGDNYEIIVNNQASADEGAQATVRETRRAKLLRAGR